MKRFPGWLAFVLLLWLLWALLAPIVAGSVPAPVTVHNCPSPRKLPALSIERGFYEVRFDECGKR